MTEQHDEEYLLREEVIKEYPVVKDWLADPSHTSVQILNDIRLLSVEEKIALLGGVKKIKEDFKEDLKTDKNKTLILLACRQDPMIPHEISKYSAQFGGRLTAATIFENIDELLGAEMLTKIPDVTYIQKDLDGFCVTTVSGYKTTPTGLMVRVPERVNYGLLGNMGLQPI